MLSSDLFFHDRDFFFSFFCQMIFSECCDLFEICIWMFSSAIWQSSESWPSVARSNASTSIWQWHLGKVFILIHPRQKYVYIKNWKGIFICVLIIWFVLLVNILSDLLAKVLLWFLFFPLFLIMYSTWYNIYTQIFMWLSFCVPLSSLLKLASKPMRVGWFLSCILQKTRTVGGLLYL